MIYFIKNENTELVKIGTTKNLDKRMRALKKKYGDGLRLLFTTAGGHIEEKFIHREFERLRVVSEWFNWDERMGKYKSVSVFVADKKFYLPGTEVEESVYLWLKEKAEKENRSLTQQLLWEVKQLRISTHKKAK